MIYKPFGKTGKEISAIGFGAMRFKPEEYKTDHEKCADILLRAWDLGVNYIDTAPLYCENNSEPIIGRAMRRLGSEKRPYVSTKCGIYQASNADEAYEQVKKSRDLLCVDKIDFYHIWSIKTMDQYWTMTKPGAMHDGLLRAQQDGLIDHICVSIHANGADVKTIVADGKVDVVTLGYNALNFAYRREGIRACYDAGVGVVVMNPLAGGMIPRREELFRFLQTSPDESVVQAALRFLIGHKEISAALPGPSSIEELEECVAAADKAYETTDAMLETLAKQLNTELDTLCTSCNYCDYCPVGLPVAVMLSVYNDCLLDATFDQMIYRLNLHHNLTPEDAAKCTRCGICEKLCTQKLPIIERLEKVSRA